MQKEDERLWISSMEVSAIKDGFDTKLQCWESSDTYPFHDY